MPFNGGELLGFEPIKLGNRKPINYKPRPVLERIIVEKFIWKGNYINLLVREGS